ncbi:30S ribosomal protein S16 [candidate division WWE3 bacterium RIFCSPLOWO2_12_FULL_36_10]|uniref:Small ribosomal subunit protein bS16 n=1 Tax=candidate division WWE3 bacterium RIFCSPLOWO2_12_FULL_36_10 TaxID=1802630 RepID=A0A1F4VKQ3_UNCKA|nr:MAG: 30S ribosomal protein S16 [candidate division WWE3 bacterium RIFCSPLOWO2_12_FULL_36_10]
MSITIRLAKFGKKFAPSYKIVVSETRNKRNGRYVDVLGHYSPLAPSNNLALDKEKYKKWVENGATVSESVTELMNGTYTYVKYTPKTKKQAGVQDTPQEGTTE